MKLAVIFGGKSSEHNVSVVSGTSVICHLDKTKYEIYPIYISKDGLFYEYTKNINEIKMLSVDDEVLEIKLIENVFEYLSKIDVVFPVLHGLNGEDGTIQGYLEMVGIPYVGSGVLGSSLGQDKVLMKQVFTSCDLPVVPYTWFYDCEYYEDKEKILKEVKKLGYPVIVKPATLGSSVGITYVKSEEGLEKAIEEAITYDIKIVVEKAVENLIEVNCSVLGNYERLEASTLEEVMSTAEFLTYRDKYLGNSKTKGSKGSKGMAGANRIVPARLDEKMTKKVQDIAKEAFIALNLSGVCRIDFLIDGDTKDIYINEPNTIPGSLSFYLWEATDKPYEELLDDMITLAIKQYKTKHSKTFSFDTNILSNFSGTKGVKGIKNKMR